MSGEGNGMYGVHRTSKESPMYGRKHSEKTKKLISESRMGDKNWAKQADVRKKIGDAGRGRKHSEKTKQIMSQQMMGEKNPFYGKTHTDEVKKILRFKRIEEIKNKLGQLSPNYNPSSISIIRQKAKELGITDLQHAENGGEFYIKELGYWVDGYSKEKNIVIEYYEKHHNRQKKRDSRRQKEIEEYLECEFIIINEE